MSTQTADDRDTTAPGSATEGPATPQRTPGDGEPTSLSTSATPATRRFLVLTTDVLPEIPAELQWPLYRRISAAVDKGTVPGLIHSTLTGQLTYMLSATKHRPKVVKEILLKNLPDLQGLIAQLTGEALSEHVITTGGRGFTAEDLLQMGDALNFDAMITVARKRRVKLSQASLKGKGKRKG